MTNYRIPGGIEHVYEFRGPLFRCAYCGEPAETTDHTTPIVFAAGANAVYRRYWLVKVAACQSCNRLASDKLDSTWGARKLRIARKLAQKHKRLLQTAHFSPEEMADFGQNLRIMIETADLAASVIRRRLIFLNDVSWPNDVPWDLRIRWDDGA